MVKIKTELIVCLENNTIRADACSCNFSHSDSHQDWFTPWNIVDIRSPDYTYLMKVVRCTSKDVGRYTTRTKSQHGCQIYFKVGTIYRTGIIQFNSFCPIITSVLNVDGA